MSIKKFRHIIFALIVVLSLALGTTSASAAPGPVREFFELAPYGITWQ